MQVLVCNQGQSCHIGWYKSFVLRAIPGFEREHQVAKQVVQLWIWYCTKQLVVGPCGSGLRKKTFCAKPGVSGGVDSIGLTTLQTISMSGTTCQRRDIFSSTAPARPYRY